MMQQLLTDRVRIVGVSENEWLCLMIVTKKI